MRNSFKWKWEQRALWQKTEASTCMNSQIKGQFFLSVHSTKGKGNSPAFLLFMKYKYCMSKKFLKSIIESPLSLHSYTHFNKIENEMFGQRKEEGRGTMTITLILAIIKEYNICPCSNLVNFEIPESLVIVFECS